MYPPAALVIRAKCVRYIEIFLIDIYEERLFNQFYLIFLKEVFNLRF
jgi:hypothetical protein